MLSQWGWHLQKGMTDKTGYAVRGSKVNGEYVIIRMHRVLTDAPAGMHVDHINGNGLDNRRFNLRVCSCSENQRNRGAQVNNTSGYKGVTWNKASKKWRAYIKKDRKQVQLGFYDSKKRAAIAYNAAAIVLHGKFAILNELK